jgi:DNA-binding MarR family transcriptional regulator
MPSARLTLRDYRALADFRHQLRRFLHFSDREVRAAGVEPQQHQLLLGIKGMPEGTPATIGALAERLQLQHHSTVELVDRMELRGFVRRLRSASDRRRVLVSLTRRGEALLARLTAAHRAEVRSIGHRLQQALDTLITDMEVVRAGARKARPRGTGKAA